MQTFDFPILYTTIPHSKLNDIFKNLVQLRLLNKMANIQNKFWKGQILFVRNHSDSSKKEISETDIIKMESRNP
jgi:hypothetical protein